MLEWNRSNENTRMEWLSMTRVVSLVVLVCAREFWKKLGAEWSECGSFFFYIFRRSGCIFFHNSYDIFRTKFVRIYAEWLDLFFYSISSSNREFASFFVHSNFARKCLFEKLLHIHLFLKYVYISRVDFYCKIKDKMDRRKIKGNNFFALDCEQIGISK